ncbi:hypothetical protein V8C34DRAFT_289240 [Trichoderma compactum]
MPLLFNQSARPKKISKSFSGPFPPQIMSLAISGYLHRQTTLVPIAYLLHDSPREPTKGGHLLSHARQIHPPEISSRPCMAYTRSRSEQRPQDRQSVNFFWASSSFNHHVTGQNTSEKKRKTLLKNTKKTSL